MTTKTNTAEVIAAAAQQVEWTAKNNSSYLNGRRAAPSLRAAVRDARHYLRNELYGEGTIHYFEIGSDYPFRTDEKSIFTGQRWVTRHE
jgi:hypothetical protein